MNEQQNVGQIDVAAVQAAEVALNRVGANLAKATQEAEFWKIKAELANRALQEAEQAYAGLMLMLEEAGVDLESLLDGSESAQDGSGAPLVVVEGADTEETGDDASAAS